MDRAILQLKAEDGSWSAFVEDWKAQCASFNEDFSSYAEGTFSVIGDLVEAPQPKVGVFAFKHDGTFVSMCQVNVTPLPGYTGPVMRVRFMTLSPNYDFGTMSVDDYSQVLVSTFSGIWALSDSRDEWAADHIKFHLSSPADRQFFASLGRTLNSVEEFGSVQMRGAWLYITKAV